MIGGHLEIITEGRYCEAMGIMENHYRQGEPLSAAFGINWSQSYERLVLSELRENLSVMAVSDETNEVMGILANSVRRKTDSNKPVEVEDEPLRALLEFIAHMDNEIDLFNRIGLSEVFYCFVLAVHTKYRMHGLGTALVGTSLALAKELGFRAVKAECTSKFSQQIAEKFGAGVIDAFPYDQYQYKDKFISESACVHSCAKIVVLKVQ